MTDEEVKAEAFPLLTAMRKQAKQEDDKEDENVADFDSEVADFDSEDEEDEEP